MLKTTLLVGWRCNYNILDMIKQRKVKKSSLAHSWSDPG
jgi:hypothetical protein